MPAPTLPVLGGSTVNRKWICEINTGTTLSPTWAALGGLMNFQLQPDQANMVGDTDQAAQGFQSSTKTGATWSAQVTVKRAPKSTDATSYDTAQEFCRTNSIGKFGNSNRIQIRVYEYDPNDPNGTAGPRVEAYMGFAAVAWDPQGGDMMALDTVNITFQGQGQLFPISHPYAVAAAVPTITSVSPATASTAGGTLVTIYGSGFTSTVATTGVKVGGTNSPSYTVYNDNQIAAVVPAKTAGAQQVVVTNSVGASTSSVSITYS